MKSKNELFMDAIEYLIDKGYADNQGDVAVKAGLGPNLISRIKNGHVKAVSDDAIRALCSEFKDLNIEYFRGKSDFISRSDQLLQESKDMLDANPPHEPLQHSAMDDSFLFEKAMKKIYDEVSGQFIESLKTQVEDQRHTIKRLEKEIDWKNETIENLQSRVRELESIIKMQTTGNPLRKYPFPVGVADDGSIRIITEK
jgi:DNA-binding Xre family transcriptional regulator